MRIFSEKMYMKIMTCDIFSKKLLTKEYGIAIMLR